MANPYNYFPASYQAAYNPYQQIYPQAMQAQAQQQPQQQQQIQNGGLVSVRNRAEAESYPIAPGNSVTFKDETAPFIYVKTMGFSQLDRPTFEMFRLVKEDAPNVPDNAPNNGVSQNSIDLSQYVVKSEFDALTARVDALEASKSVRSAKKKEGDENE